MRNILPLEKGNRCMLKGELTGISSNKPFKKIHGGGLISGSIRTRNRKDLHGSRCG